MTLAVVPMNWIHVMMQKTAAAVLKESGVKSWYNPRSPWIIHPPLSDKGF